MQFTVCTTPQNKKNVEFVKIGDAVSATTTVGAGTPQDTVSGPNDFKVSINDLTFNTTYAKYVDNTALSVSWNVNDSALLSNADFLVLAINTNKTKYSSENYRSKHPLIFLGCV